MFLCVGHQRKTKEQDFVGFARTKNRVRAKKWKKGRGRKEMRADKPLDFENCRLDLSCLSVHTTISCWPLKSSPFCSGSELWRLVKICLKQRAYSCTVEMEISWWIQVTHAVFEINLKVKFGNFKSSYVPTENLLNLFKGKNCMGEVLALICLSGKTWQVFMWHYNKIMMITLTSIWI